MPERDIDVASLGILVADVFGRPIDEWPQRGRLSLVKEMGIGTVATDSAKGAHYTQNLSKIKSILKSKEALLRGD